MECVNERRIDPMTVFGIVVKNHESFSWGKDVAHVCLSCCFGGGCS